MFNFELTNMDKKRRVKDAREMRILQFLDKFKEIENIITNVKTFDILVDTANL